METVTIHDLPVANMYSDVSEIPISTWVGDTKETTKLSIGTLAKFINNLNGVGVQQEDGNWIPSIKFYKNINGTDEEFTPDGFNSSNGVCSYVKTGNLITVKFTNLSISVDIPSLPAEFSHYTIGGLPYVLPYHDDSVLSYSIDSYKMLADVDQSTINAISDSPDIIEPVIYCPLPNSFEIGVNFKNLSTNEKENTVPIFKLSGASICGSLTYLTV